MTQLLPSHGATPPAVAGRPARRLAGAVAVLVLAGCAGGQPPAAAPPASPPLKIQPAGRVAPLVPVRPARVAQAGGTRTAVLRPRERRLDLYAGRRRLASVPAGIGPARLASDGRNLLYVTDPVGQAVLVFHVRPRFELTRRVPRPGGPWAIAYDRDRNALWITLAATNQVAEYVAGTRPGPRAIYASVRAPLGVTVTAGEVQVFGRDARQVLDLPRTR